MPLSKLQMTRILLIQEIRILLVSPALWAMLIILSLLVGYSFIQAVDLFSKASQTALAYPEFATGINPLEGIFVPTFGAYYLVETLLLPFVIIHLVGRDKHNGNLKLLLQLPLSPFALNGIKLAAMAVVWLLMLIAALSVLGIWQYLGGEIYFPEILTLILGHSLYVLTIVCIAMFATTVTSTLATAAIICLTATLGSWILDFTSSGQEGWLGALSHISLTALLRQFESGLLSLASVGVFLALSLLFFITASTLLHTGRSTSQRLKILSISIGVLLVLFMGLL